MDLVSLGSSSLQVSRIGLGMAALGRPGYINLGHGDDLEGLRRAKELEGHAFAVLDAAYASGIRYFDAARSYGKAEKFLGRWLDERGLLRGSATIGSKWGYTYTADWKVDAAVHETKDHSLPTLQRQLAESTALLGDHLSVYQIHSATESSAVLDRSDVLTRLRELASEGMTIGLTTSGTDQATTIRRAIGLTVDGAPLFQSVQATWNVFETSAGEALAEAHAAGLGVIVKEALANGRLTGRNPELPGLLRVEGHGADAVAIAAVLAQPWVDVVLSGAANVGQLESNLAALDVPSGTVAALGDVTEPADEYWATRSRLTWT